MADTLKVLGQIAPNITTEADLYTVPAATSTTISSITVCNRAATSALFRISVAIAGAATSNIQYLYYNTFLDAYDTFVATIGISLATTDKIRVYNNTGSLTFHAYGVEIT